MTGELTPLEREEQIDQLLEESHARPVVIFKFSRTCGTSAYAADELHTYLQGAPADACYAVVTVQAHRAVSNAIAARLGVRHESPQLIVLRDGAVAWHGSHYRVTADELAGALTLAAGAR
jgi:bacillithiol system protein YtxJ